MFDNCKSCALYDDKCDDMFLRLSDYKQATTPPHFCTSFPTCGIPNEIWDGTVKCEHYHVNRYK